MYRPNSIYISALTGRPLAGRGEQFGPVHCDNSDPLGRATDTRTQQTLGLVVLQLSTRQGVTQLIPEKLIVRAQHVCVS